MLRGFYRSTFTDADGRERVIATTQMQSTDCRRAFPCWDEPDMKAVFGITLDVAPDLVALSNGPEIARETLPDGRQRVRFEDTMMMSTYLVAMVVGPLEATETVDVDGIPLRILHVPGKGHLTGFGLDVAEFCLRWFQDYYGLPYPGRKVDLVALPDFAFGAMENLGCITFRENLLLVDPAAATHHERQLVADVVAHELAHMWFGDLVTMRWWNGIWLNEAFATFMEIAACDAYRPDWERWSTFGQERTAAFEADALSSTRPVEYEVRSPADSEGMFDVLTYQKGGALLRMLEQYLSPAAFRAGVSHYLARHAYANTETSDLWDAIEETSGEPVRRMMDSWIWQRGFPLVHVDLDGDALVLRQERFLYPTGQTRPADPTTWVVPVHLRLDGESERVLLDAPHTRVPLSFTPSGPVVVNAGGVGFYRVAYSEQLRVRFDASALAGLEPLERYCLVDDTWSAVVADRLPASAFLDLASSFGAERDVAVWQALAAGLRACGRLVDGEDHTRFQLLVRSLVGPVLEQVGWSESPDEDELTSKLRGLLVSLHAVLGADPGTQEHCRALLTRAEQDSSATSAELVAAATSVVAATGTVADFDRFESGFRSAANPQEQLRLLYALAEFDDPDLVLRACELALSDEVRSQTGPFLLQRCIANRRHGELAWHVVRDRWDEVVTRFPSGTIIRMVDAVKLLTSPTAAQDVPAFFAEHPLPQAATTLAQVLERQQVNVALRRREERRLGDWLASR
jgi:puromycin-sensitive aminopeptidase